MIEPVDEATARRLLERALANDGKPALPPEAIDDLMAVAYVEDAEGTVGYTAASLNVAAAIGWNWKAGLVAEQYDLGAGAGVTLSRAQWFAHCRAMSAAYATGEIGVMSVAPPASKATLGSIQLVSSALPPAGTPEGQL